MKTSTILLANGLKIYFGIILFFFVMKFFNLEKYTEFRVLNFVFVLYGVNQAIKQNIKLNRETNYLSNLYIGFATAVFAIILVCLSLIFYLNQINPDFIKIIENLKIWGKSLTPFKVVFAIFTEGISSAIIISFIVMQIWKNFKFTETP
ncbi:MAG: hypothetical protein ACWA42_11285 [Lutibacter sp.]